MEIMDKYEMLAVLVLSLFLIPVGYLVFWVVRIMRSQRLPPSPPVDNEPWTYNGDQLTITYRSGSRPDQGAIDEIKDNINRYEAMIAERVRETEGSDVDFTSGVRLAGISFPIWDDEQGEYDFSISYEADDGSDMVFDAYFKDGRVLEVAAAD